MESEQIARVCHEVNRAYCAATGDALQGPWEDTPANIRDSAVNGVEAALANPEITPEQLHANWCDYKRAEGWVYGEVKDVDAKTHPCLVEYADLPAGQRVKDYLFRAIVSTLK